MSRDILEVCRQSRELLEMVLDCVRQAIIITDPQGHIRFTNQAAERILGYDYGQLLGQPLAVIFTPEDLDHLYPNLFWLIGRGQSFEGEVLLSRADGGRLFTYLTFQECAARDAENLVVVTLQDIQREKELERLFRETHYDDLVKIADGVAHELRNPLMGIGGLVGRLHRACAASPDRTDEYYRYIMGDLGKIEGVVRKIRELVNLPRPDLEPQDCRRLLDDAAAVLDDRMRTQGVNLHNQLGESRLRLDAGLVRKGFAILLENSLDAMPQGGDIWASQEREREFFRVVYSDSGPGIPENDLPYVFNPFFSTKADGVGLDLALLKRIMQSLGGQVEALPNPEGGAHFRLSFPLERRRLIRTQRLDQLETGAEREPGRM